MKGLLLKDFYNQKAIIKMMTLVFIIWMFIAYVNKNSNMLVAFIPFVGVVTTINAIALDFMVKFDSFAVSMPVSRYEIVFSKYLFNVAITIIGLVIGFIFDLFMGSPLNINLLFCLLSFSVSLILAAVAIPLVFKFGVQKAKIIIMIICVAPLLFIPILPNIIKDIPKITDSQVTTAICFLPVVVIALTFLSAKISENIYMKKDF